MLDKICVIMQEFLQRYKKIFIKNIKIIFDSLNKFLIL